VEELFQKTFEEISVTYDKNHRQVSTDLSDLEIRIKGTARQCRTRLGINHMDQLSKLRQQDSARQRQAKSRQPVKIQEDRYIKREQKSVELEKTTPRSSKSYLH